MSPARAMKLKVFCAVMLLIAAAWYANELAVAESGDQKKPTPKPSMVDEAKILIEKQRSYVYEYDTKDIFADIFSFVTPAPTMLPVSDTVEVTSTPKNAPEDIATMRKLKAKEEVAVAERRLKSLLEQKRYQTVIDTANRLFDQYKDIGPEAETIFAPLAPYVIDARKMIALTEQFNELTTTIKIYAICWGERAQSVIINGGVFVLKGDNISNLFGDSAPKDLVVEDIKPDRIVVSSKELGLSKEILLLPEKSSGENK